MFSIDLHPGITIVQTKERLRGSHVLIHVADRTGICALSMRCICHCLLVFVISTLPKTGLPCVFSRCHVAGMFS